MDAASVDLAAWIDAGRLLTGGIGLPPRVTVAATVPRTGEAEAEAGEFLLTRTGPLAGTLEVALSIGGSALNGTDYAAVSGRVIFPAGERHVRVLVTPFPDSQPEAAETVELVVQPGAGYTLGAADRARVVIEDWQSSLSVVALEPFATLRPLKSALVRVVSSAPVDRPMDVVLNIGGTAEAGVHYQPIRRTLTLAAGQSSATLEVVAG